MLVKLTEIFIIIITVDPCSVQVHSHRFLFKCVLHAHASCGRLNLLMWKRRYCIQSRRQSFSTKSGFLFRKQLKVKDVHTTSPHFSRFLDSPHGSSFRAGLGPILSRFRCSLFSGSLANFISSIIPSLLHLHLFWPVSSLGCPFL